MLPQSLLHDLKTLLQERRVAIGIALLDENRDSLAAISGCEPGAGTAVGCLAQWLDLGYEDSGLLSGLITTFADVRSQLPIEDYLQLRLAEGLLAMRQENLTQATSHLDAVLTLASDLKDTRSAAIALFWKARCLRKAGEYDQAEILVQRGVEVALETGLPFLAAAIRTLASWLSFQRGNTKAAVKVLQEAEAVLRETDDFISLGNIQSTYGRIALREGRYNHALSHFEGSLELFRRPSLEGYLARTLTNIAQAKRFLAEQLRRNIDAKSERNRIARQDGALFDARGKTAQLERMHELLRNAEADLAEAGRIYQRIGNNHGAGNVAVNLAQIHLDLADLEQAEQYAASAFELGAQKTDYLLMCRARIVQAAVANARFEEQIGEDGDPSRFAQLAHDCAKEAVAFGQRTESKRLLAQAYISQGSTLVNGFFHNTDLARACCSQAEAYLNQDRQDALWQEVEILRASILHAGIEDPNLRAWSQGAIGDKTLQDVVEQFEELLIRKVWEHEGRKVSRVAQRLAVSPKKVRRILRQLGLLVDTLEPAHEAVQ
jgi:tetratricopeptide (TPR) repeat protein